MATTAQDRLNQILPLWHDQLTQWSSDGSLVAAATDALMLDGPNARKQSKGLLQSCVAQWSARNYKHLPTIALLSYGYISGAEGAYADSKDTIYLNQDWLLGASDSDIQTVLTHELGHFLDFHLNKQDTQGEEGDYFSQLLFTGLAESNRNADENHIPIQVENNMVLSEAALVPLSSSSVTVNGSSSISSTTINLINGGMQAGSAWMNQAVDLTKDWSTTFTTVASGGSGTQDGFTFAIDGDPRGLSALGLLGQNLGFFADANTSTDELLNSYAVLFDMWVTSPASLLGFSSSHLPQANCTQGNIQLPISLTNNTYDVGIAYSATQKQLSVTVGGQTFTQSVDLVAATGVTTAYLGFTGGGGGGTMPISVNNWNVNASASLVRLWGDTSSNTLIGTNGNDLMSGCGIPLNGVDTIDGRSGVDTVSEVGDYNFVISGSPANGSSVVGSKSVNGSTVNYVKDSMTNIEVVQIAGGSSANTIDASTYSGQSSLNGLDGNDIITGGFGVDILTGGLGADVFRFFSKPTILTSATADHITDFTSVQSDIIQISRSSFGIKSTAKVGFTATSSKQTLSQALGSGNLIVLDSTTGDLWYNQNGNSTGAGTGGIFAVLDKNSSGLVPSISASNFVFV